ncbi:cytochrome P450 [Myxococcota bacterium]|nr:cytochrome P450 [Myxococcota bacterium]
MSSLAENLDVLDPVNIENPYPLFATLRTRHPVYRIPGTEVYWVSDRAHIEEALNRHDIFSANLTGVLMTDPTGLPVVFELSAFGSAVDAIANADEPEHAVHRKLVLPGVRPGQIAEMESAIRSRAQREVDTLVAHRGGDWIERVANPIPTQAMAQGVGLPLEDADKLLEWAMSGTEILAGTTRPDRMQEIGTATADLSRYLSERLEEALSANPSCPVPGIISDLAEGVQAGQIKREMAVSILVVLAGAGGESTAGLLGNAARLLALHPEVQQELRATPSLIPRFVEEVLRLESPFKGHYRASLQETQLGQTRIPAGSRLFLLWAAANRDPDRFPHPDEIDLHRKNPQDHLSFGRGIHFCIGARLARLEARVVLEELLARTRSFELNPDAPPRHVPSIFVRRLETLPLQMTAP